MKSILLLFTLVSYSCLTKSENVLGDGPTLEQLTGQLALSTPNSPAFDILGISPQNVVTPGSGQEFAFSFAPILVGGESGLGMAFDINPYYILSKEYIGDQQLNSAAYRFFSRINISYANTSGIEETEDIERQALGLTWTYEFEHPILSKKGNSLVNCLKLIDTQSPVVDSRIGDGRRTISQEVQSKINNCYKHNNTRFFNWNRSVFSAGIAAYKANSEIFSSSSGSALWLTRSWGVSDKWLLTGHIRYNDDRVKVNEDVMDDGDDTTSVDIIDDLFIGTRIQFQNGADSNTRFMFEYGWNDEKVENGENDTFSRAAIGFQYELPLKSPWFVQFWYGDTFGKSGDSDEMFQAQLRYALDNNNIFSKN